jgi:hypothetical protein
MRSLLRGKLTRFAVRPARVRATLCVVQFRGSLRPELAVLAGLPLYLWGVHAYARTQAPARWKLRGLGARRQELRCDGAHAALGGTAEQTAACARSSTAARRSTSTTRSSP